MAVPGFVPRLTNRKFFKHLGNKTKKPSQDFKINWKKYCHSSLLAHSMYLLHETRRGKQQNKSPSES